LTEAANADALHSLARAACEAGRLPEGIAYARQALALDPQRARTHLLLGMALAQSGYSIEALASLDRAIAIAPGLAAAYGNRGDVLVAIGRQDEAIASYDIALALVSDSLENWCNRGAALHDLKRYEEALASFDRVLALKPDFTEVHINRGNALAALRRHQDAIAAYDSALALAPDHVDALTCRGDALRASRRYAQALESYDRALALAGDRVPVLMGRGIALIELARLEAALACFDRVLAIEPDSADALNNRGFVLNALDRRDEALASYDRALRHNSDHAEAFVNRGVVLSDLGLHQEAIRSYEQALAGTPDHVGALCNRAKALFTLNRFNEALASAERALAVDPDHAEALFTRGNVLVRLNRYADAIADYERTLTIDPQHRYASAALANCFMTICDWEKLGRAERDLIDRVAADRLIVSPFALCGLSVEPASFLRCAKAFADHEIPRVASITPSRAPAASAKIKLAYLSADFRRHPVAMLMAELFELHDRQRFEVIGISVGADDRSDVRARVAAAFDRFHQVAGQGDREIASLLHDLGVDILLDLGGYTDGARTTILAYRPAPIQVSYIGFLATMGASFIDYLIADAVVIPAGEDRFYSERIVRLPECFQVNDSKRKISSRVPSRGEAGLPEGAFVFCCFNANYKIMAPTFEVWMRLLHAVEGSVLWLFQSNDAAVANLRREARARGIDPARLIFAPRANPEDHLARHALADLFLDTLPINAGATASDALWAGLPIVTLTGDRFLSRVSASLLQAVGLPELVTRNRADYEALALRLATDRALLASIRRKLADNRRTHPLFDTDRFRRHIEAAYSTMWETWRRGESPRSFAVAPI